MDRVKRNSYFLRYLGSVQSSAQRKSLLESASADQITSLAEIAYNILGGVFELANFELISLRRYKNVLRKLASKQLRHWEKRNALLENSIAVKHLLTVFFAHYKSCENGFGRDTAIGSNTSDSVSTTGSDSETSSDSDPA